MPLATGSPVGYQLASEDLFLDSAPYIYYQDARANPLFNPDSDGFYWGLSGTAQSATGTAIYAVYELGCPKDVTLTEGLTMNDVACDTVGFKGTVQQRNYFEFTVSVQNFFPFDVLSPIMGGGTTTHNITNHTQKMPLGKMNNSIFYHLYAPMIYDATVSDYIWFYFHRCQFIDAWTINMSYGTPWALTGVKFRAFADSTKPSAQLFGMFGRSDLSVVV
jgi:hypothetical protein